MSAPRGGCMLICGPSLRPTLCPTLGVLLMSSSSPALSAKRLTLTEWLILIMAAIGFAFDIYELLMLPLILRPSLQELVPSAAPGSTLFNFWAGMMFWVPAIAGGIFGLMGGYLTDRLGRRRVLTWGILLYAVS